MNAANTAATTQIKKRRIDRGSGGSRPGAGRSNGELIECSSAKKMLRGARQCHSAATTLRRRYSICTLQNVQLGGKNATRGQIKIHGEREAAGGAHRGRLRVTRGTRSRGRAPRLGNRQQGPWWRGKARRQRLWQERESRADAEGRKKFPFGTLPLVTKKNKRA